MPYIIADVIAPRVTTTSTTATQTIDGSVAQIFPFTLGLRHDLYFDNFVPGETVTLVLTQNGTGSMTGTFPSGVLFPGAD